MIIKDSVLIMVSKALASPVSGFISNLCPLANYSLVTPVYLVFTGHKFLPEEILYFFFPVPGVFAFTYSHGFFPTILKYLPTDHGWRGLCSDSRDDSPLLAECCRTPLRLYLRSTCYQRSSLFLSHPTPYLPPPPLSPLRFCIPSP